jgi:hypothetical protein
MDHRTGDVLLAGAAMIAMGFLASPVTTAQTPSVASTGYVAKVTAGDCGPDIASMQVSGAALPLPAVVMPATTAVAGPVEVHQLAQFATDASKTAAPYSAVSTSETVRTLDDGNRIVHTNTSRIYRDSSGRVRTETSLSLVGPSTLEQSSTLVSIIDPIGKQHLMLHPADKRAEVLPFSFASIATATSSSSQDAVSTAGVTTTGASVTAFSKTERLPTTAVPAVSSVHCAPGVSSSRRLTTVVLGRKTISGLAATGTRMEYTIPAGRIGNEQPITVTIEQWVSDELGVVLSSTRHDPMNGETQSNLSQIERTEPDPSLFVIPADYTVTDVSKSIVMRPVPPG